jgi:phenylalanyl-tRNA synthetase beta subunit
VTRLSLTLSDDVAQAAAKFFSGDEKAISYAVDRYLRNFFRRWKLLKPRAPWQIKKRLERAGVNAIQSKT